MFFTANFFYSYQQNVINGLSFDLQGRTLYVAQFPSVQPTPSRSLSPFSGSPSTCQTDCHVNTATDESNSALYWAAQIFGGLAIPVICDFPPLLPTRSRAIVAWTCLFIFGNITMLAGSSFETQRQEHEEVWIRFRGPGCLGRSGVVFRLRDAGRFMARSKLTVAASPNSSSSRSETLRGS